MNWKSYAVVSGATVLAGWLASAPTSNAPSNAQSPQTRTPSASRAPSTAETDIELEAMRLQARLRPEGAYAEPSRDPFRFAPRRAAAAVVERERAPAAPASPPDAVESPAPPALMLSLSGIAEDEVDGRMVRTAVLSSPAGVLLVREGEEILGVYRVDRIESEAVALVRLADGSPTRLSLR